MKQHPKLIAAWCERMLKVQNARQLKEEANWDIINGDTLQTLCLIAESKELLAQADRLWLEAIIRVYPREEIVFDREGVYRLGNGEVYSPSDILNSKVFTHYYQTLLDCQRMEEEGRERVKRGEGLSLEGKMLISEAKKIQEDALQALSND